MTSWVYIFSKFTPEALLFEALLICVLLCIYTAFWVLKKRRYGSVDTSLPSGPVKSYLNELISNAEHIRLQLFGLLASPDYDGSRSMFSSRSVDPEIEKKLAQMELKLAEQGKNLELVSQEKARLEKAIAENTGSENGNSPLQQRVQELESRLAEYSVIEDDLANLKRLQQENAQLKAQLAGKGITPATLPETTNPESSAPASEPASEPVSEVSESPSPPAEAAESPTELTPAPDEVNKEPEAAAPAEPTEAAPAQTEAPAGASAMDTAPAAESSPAAPTPAAASETPPNPEGTSNAEADLVAEFEKMLKG